MWFLVWMHFVSATGQFEYYQVGVYGSQEQCEIEKSKAKVMVVKNNTAVHCFEVDRKK
tara:strand:+ start:148 stop:321 length:174 start_codon:yes stop_codon:yes gene_type:complete